MIVDASALVKLILEETDSDKARKIISDALKEGEDIMVPDIALSEALNAMWKESHKEY